jgi:zona occludens toxin
LGLNKTYRVEMWEGYKLTFRSRLSVENKRYDEAIFPLYSSYQGGSGKEMRVDDRQNVLKSPKLWILAGFVVVTFSVAIYFVFSFFSGSKYKYKDKDTGHTSQPVSTSQANGRPAAKTAGPDVSDLWRIVGTYQVNDSAMVVLTNDVGAVRLEHPSAFQNSGQSMVGQVDGQRVMYWSGVPHPQKASK